MSSVDFEIHGVAGKDLYPGVTVWSKNAKNSVKNSASSPPSFQCNLEKVRVLIGKNG